MVEKPSWATIAVISIASDGSYFWSKRENGLYVRGTVEKNELRTLLSGELVMARDIYISNDRVAALPEWQHYDAVGELLRSVLEEKKRVQYDCAGLVRSQSLVGVQGIR